MSSLDISLDEDSPSFTLSSLDISISNDSDIILTGGFDGFQDRTTKLKHYTTTRRMIYILQLFNMIVICALGVFTLFAFQVLIHGWFLYWPIALFCVVSCILSLLVVGNGLRYIAFVVVYVLFLIGKIVVSVIGVAIGSIVLFEMFAEGAPLNFVHQDLVDQYYCVLMLWVTLILGIVIDVVSLGAVGVFRKMFGDLGIRELLCFADLVEMKLALCSKRDGLLAVVVRWVGFVVLVMSVVLSVVCFVSYFNLYATAYYECYDSSCIDGCNPIDDSHCLLPIPSDFYLDDNGITPSGKKVNIPIDAMLPLKSGNKFTNEYVNTFDGWSTTGALSFYFRDVDDAVLTKFRDIAKSVVQNQTTTLVINTETGALHPHFTELDHADDPNRGITLIQPGRTFDFNTTYVVVVKDLKDTSGNMIKPYKTMAALLKQDYTDISEKIVRLFKSTVLPVLLSKGIELDSVQMAWSFTTQSAEFSFNRPLALKSTAMSYFKSNNKAIAYSVEKVVNNECTDTTLPGRIIYGSFSYPSFLSKGRGTPFSGSRLDISTEVIEEKRAQYTVVYPCSVIKAEEAKMLVHFGHGLFADRDKVLREEFIKLAEDNQWIYFSMDWLGFSRFDLLHFANAILIDPANGIAGVSDTVLQGFILRNLGSKMIRGSFSHLDEFKVNGNEVMPSKVAYMGISLGGILGGGFAAVSDDVERSALNVPGAPLSFILSRSLDFGVEKYGFAFSFYSWQDARISL